MYILPEDFDTTKEFELFTVLYSIPKDLDKNILQEWIVTGYRLENSSDKRSMNCILMSHPISKYILQVKHGNTNDLRRFNYVSIKKKDVLELKQKDLKEYFETRIKEITSQ